MRGDIGAGTVAFASLFVIGINLLWVTFVAWVILSFSVMVLRPVTGTCEQNWGVDSVVVFERAFCPVDKTTGE